MQDPIEGQFRVVGEKQPCEPMVNSWGAFIFFFGIIALAIFLKAESFKSEARDRLGSSSSEASRNATAEQTPASGTGQHLTQ